MALSAHAWRLREAARQALRDGQIDRAYDLAAEAQELQHTATGEALHLLCAALIRCAAPSPDRSESPHAPE